MGQRSQAQPRQAGPNPVRHDAPRQKRRARNCARSVRACVIGRGGLSRPGAPAAPLLPGHHTAANSGAWRAPLPRRRSPCGTPRPTAAPGTGALQKLAVRRLVEGAASAAPLSLGTPQPTAAPGTGALQKLAGRRLWRAPLPRRRFPGTPRPTAAPGTGALQKLAVRRLWRAPLRGAASPSAHRGQQRRPGRAPSRSSRSRNPYAEGAASRPPLRSCFSPVAPCGATGRLASALAAHRHEADQAHQQAQQHQAVLAQRRDLVERDSRPPR
jgi:hypothetical protein